jgi:hypothetical protein
MDTVDKDNNVLTGTPSALLRLPGAGAPGLNPTHADIADMCILWILFEVKRL